MNRAVSMTAVLIAALAAGPTSAPSSRPTPAPSPRPAVRLTPAAQSVQNLELIAKAMLLYQNDTAGKFPPDLPALFKAEDVFTPDEVRVALTNPTTGRNPGYWYVKPPAGANPTTTPIVRELAANGRPNVAGPVLYADLHVAAARPGR